MEAPKKVAGPKTLGRKVFFLYPHSVIQDELVNELVQNEYEVYFLNDYRRAARAFAHFTDSICFINIDDGIPEPQWEQYVRGIMENPTTKGVRIGILSYNSDRDLMQKYLMDLAVQCGYVQLKLGIEESTRIVLEVLKANEAKGRRQFVRANCEDDRMATFNVRNSGAQLHGRVRDLSSRGMACTFDRDPKFVKGTVLQDAQLRLRGQVVNTGGVVLGSRAGEPPVYVVLFSESREMEPIRRIRRYVHTTLQRQMEKDIALL